MNLRDKLFSKKKEVCRIHHKDENASARLSQSLKMLIPSRTVPFVIVCIGTDRATGDALGPLVGSQLRKTLPASNVFGTLESPVHAVNLQETIDKIEKLYNDPFIVGIDACLGKYSSIGMITIGEGPVQPGTGVNKRLPPVGNIHMTGIVNVGGFMEYFVLQNTRLSLVMSMANIIAAALSESFATNEKMIAIDNVASLNIKMNKKKEQHFLQ